MAKRKSKKKRKKGNAPKLRPKQTSDGRVMGGTYALSTLLKGNLDGRFAIAKARDKLEADLVDYAGGLDECTPPIMVLIKKIVHKTLVTQQGEKLALLGEVDLDKTYLAMANSLRLDVMALENLLANTSRGKGQDLGSYIDAAGKEKK